MAFVDDIFAGVSVVARAARDEIPEFEKGPHIHQLQKFLVSVGLTTGPLDGVWGPMTRAAVREYLSNPAASEQDPLTAPAVVPELDLDALPLLDLREKEHGGPNEYQSRKYVPQRSAPPSVIVLHWTAGPVSNETLARFFARTERQVSSHYTIDVGGVARMLPDEYSAFHAGWINDRAIGIDICQPVQADRVWDALEAQYSTRVIRNPSERGGFVNVCQLDPLVAAQTLALVDALCERWGIPRRVPRNADGTVNHGVIFERASDLAGWSGVLGHHHVSSRKWDVAPWWGDIFGGTELGD